MLKPATVAASMIYICAQLVWNAGIQTSTANFALPAPSLSSARIKGDLMLSKAQIPSHKQLVKAALSLST